MNCPNCGTYYDENEKICKKCHTPLSNAVYNQVSSGNDINQPAPKRKSFVPIVAAILICCLIAGGIGGYFYYISRVKQGCREATRQIFTYAKNMDFSDVAEGRCGSFRFTGTTEVRTKRKRTRKTTIKNIHR